ncbi:nuclear transport factor 2 family protein [Lacinutrix sp.]|uniref:nuclear transport factor 2 family protein n=1 Tax=Lacinutrix sp. TaxID=1937692 RepID=UPI0035C7E291
MKQLFKFLFILTFVLSSCQKDSKPQNTEAEEFKRVEQVVQGVFDDVWAAKKEEMILNYQTKDFVLLEHGEIWTNDTIASWCKKAKLRDDGTKRINNFNFFKAKKEGNRIWMAYHNHATFKKDTIVGKYEWLESIVAVKQDSVWKLELMHSTRVGR